MRCLSSWADPQWVGRKPLVELPRIDAVSVRLIPVSDRLTLNLAHEIIRKRNPLVCGKSCNSRKTIMNDFKETTERVNKTVSNMAECLEKESAELIDYLNREVVPAVREHSTKALRVAADKLRELADYMDEAKKP